MLDFKHMSPIEKLKGLREACRRGDDDLAISFLTHGADAGASIGRSAATPLGWACSKDRLGVVNELCDRGANPWMAADKEGNTAWHVAIMNSAHQSLCAMGSRFKNFTSPGKGIYSPLHAAIRIAARKTLGTKRPDSAKLLESIRVLAQNFLLDEVDGWGFSPLASAAREGLVDVMAVLLDAGADPNQRSINGVTPLMIASKCDSGACAMLLARGADPLLVDASSATAFHWAVKRGSAEAVAALGNGAVLAMPDVDGKLALERLDGNGFTPLMRAASNGSEELVLALLDAGADPNARGQFGRAALMACKKDTRMCGLLLSRGADPLLVDEDGSTALHWAVERGCSEAIIALAAGAAMEMRDRGGLTAAQRAADAPLSERAKACLESGVIGMGISVDGAEARRMRL